MGHELKKLLKKTQLAAYHEFLEQFTDDDYISSMHGGLDRLDAYEELLSKFQFLTQHSLEKAHQLKNCRIEEEVGDGHTTANMERVIAILAEEMKSVFDIIGQWTESSDS